MAGVFETFVHTALREALGLSERQFPKARRSNRLHLDHAHNIRLEPRVNQLTTTDNSLHERSPD